MRLAPAAAVQCCYLHAILISFCYTLWFCSAMGSKQLLVVHLTQRRMILDRGAVLKMLAGPAPEFHERTVSDRCI